MGEDLGTEVGTEVGTDVGTEAEPPDVRARWLGRAVWPVAASVAVVLAVLALQVARVLSGEGLAFLGLDGGADTYDRVAGYVYFTTPDRQLVPALLGLAAASWLVLGPCPSAPARRVTTALAGVLVLEAAGLLVMTVALVAGAPSPDEEGGTFLGEGQELLTFGGPLAGAAVLLAASLLLLLVLLRPPRTVLPAGTAAPAGRDAAAERPADVDGADGLERGGALAPADEPADPYAAFRRPT